MIIEKYLKLFALFFIIVPWTVCLQSNDGGDLWKFIQSTNFSDKYKKKLMNEMEEIPKWIKTVSENPNLEDQLKQCRSQIESFKDNELRLKQNYEIITIQRVSIADKTSLLEIQKNETVKAYQQIDDYRDQLREKELEIKKLQRAILSYNNNTNNNNVQRSDKVLKLESTITICKESVNNKDVEISRLKTSIESKIYTINKNNADISKLESTVKNNNEIIAMLESTIKSYNSTINKNNAEISKLKSEKINPRATTPQPRITCPSYNNKNKSQQEITQLKSEANKQTNEIKELKIKLNKSLSNNTNLANSRDENFKKYQNAQRSIGKKIISR
ncbi:myb-like protein D [Drosophila sulfurigaster albostrigata]|uniref:myb-like protein D n=1 Tax=Drosophila sulfurigaster albostrigata TaxID=89887 RepID=UPI002D21B37A|nr:myb-like protein D [Drosophila sulfurigaster albostrigata]